MQKLTVKRNDLIGKSWIGDCFISIISKQGILDLVEEWIKTKKKGHYISAINVGKLVMMQQNDRLKNYAQQSSVNIADGFPIYLATRLLGNPVPERITGVELMENLFSLADEGRHRVYFLGARPEVLEAVIFKCRKEYPNLVVVGCQDGYFDKQNEMYIVKDIAAADADMLFVGLGLPQKEYFVDDHLSQLNTVVTLPVGGAFDVYAGTKKRAPAWIQNVGLEWLWRSFYDKTKALLVIQSIGPFIFMVLKEFLRNKT